MKASNVVAPAKVTKDVPDLEEAFEEEDDGEVVAEPKEDDEETELKKDKYSEISRETHRYLFGTNLPLQ
jgi:replication factor C subunit 1